MISNSKIIDLIYELRHTWHYNEDMVQDFITEIELDCDKILSIDKPKAYLKVCLDNYNRKWYRKEKRYTCIEYREELMEIKCEDKDGNEIEIDENEYPILYKIKEGLTYGEIRKQLGIGKQAFCNRKRREVLRWHRLND